MAHGTPDYYSGVDITYQALSEIIVRPKYGAAAAKSVSVLVSPGSKDLFTAITGRGMIYGGLVFVEAAESHQGDSANLVIDGVPLGQLSLLYLDRYQAFDPVYWPVVITRYDDVNFIYSVAFAYGYTFDNSFTVRYINNTLVNVTVGCIIHYALL